MNFDNSFAMCMNEIMNRIIRLIKICILAIHFINYKKARQIKFIGITPCNFCTHLNACNRIY